MTISRRLTTMFLISGSLLLIPLIAMFLTEDVNWSAGDFIVMAILLATTCLAIEFVLRMTKKSISRIFVIAAIVLLFLALWAELAVGVFGTPFAGS